MKFLISVVAKFKFFEILLSSFIFKFSELYQFTRYIYSYINSNKRIHGTYKLTREVVTPEIRLHIQTECKKSSMRQLVLLLEFQPE
jgi:hypothetical protein